MKSAKNQFEPLTFVKAGILFFPPASIKNAFFESVSSFSKRVAKKSQSLNNAI